MYLTKVAKRDTIATKYPLWIQDQHKKTEAINIRINSNRIYLLMAEQEHTQASLAPLCGISRQSICTMLTRGTAAPKSVGKIAKALGVDPIEIIEVED